MQNDIFSVPTQQHRFNVLMRYCEAMEKSDVETVASILQDAESDLVLEKMLLEMNETYHESTIERAAVTPAEMAVIHDLVNSYLAPSSLHKQKELQNEFQHEASRWQMVRQGRAALTSFLLHFWLVLTRQPPLIQKSLWLVNLFVLGLSGVFAVYITFISPSFLYDAALELALVTSVASAGSLVYLCSSKGDVSQEILLSTPTNQALILLSRFIVLVGYNLGLSLILTFVLAALHGVNPLDIAQIWVGPVLLLSSISLALAVILGSLSTLLGILLVEGLQMLQAHFSGATLLVAHNFLWQTNMPVFLLACGCTALACVYRARYPRLTSDVTL